MHFELTEVQQQFSTSLRRWADKEYRFEQRRARLATTDTATWDALTELGALALPIPANQGGFDGNVLDLLPVMQEIGRALVCTPYWATIVGAECLTRAKAHFDVLESIARGQCKLALALLETHARYDAHDVRTTATQYGEGYRVHGTKTAVIYGAQADKLIVSARHIDDAGEAGGLLLFLVDAHTPGILCHDQRSLDGQRLAEIRFEQVEVDAFALIGREDDGQSLLNQVLDYATVLLCGETLGIMQACLEQTIDYVKTRQQFNAPIAKFQVLQHRLADMYMELEQARSITYLAAAQFVAQENAAYTVSAAKVRVTQAARLIGQEAVQMHGGMGVTDEMMVAHMFKRLTMLELCLGDAEHHLERFCAQAEFATLA